MQIHGRLFLFVLAMAGASLAGYAQNGAASKTDVNKCTDWLRTMVPAGTRVDYAEFCAGARQEQVPNLGGWFSNDHCGPAARPGPEVKEPFCASSGIISPNLAIAVGFRSVVADGRDLMPENGDSAGAAATFYTLTPVQMEQLHLAAGLYRFTISHPADGWKMTVASEAGKEIGTVSLIGAGNLTYSGSGLAISLHYSGFRCKDPVNVHELTFTYGRNELYACMRPDRAAIGEKAVARQ